MKDENLVHSAAAAPKNLCLYDEVDDPLALGVHLCAAVVRNHPFNDANKRTAAAAMIEFLALNGWDLVVPDDESDVPLLGKWVEKLVSGALTPEQFYDHLVHFLQERLSFEALPNSDQHQVHFDFNWPLVAPAARGMILARAQDIR